MPGASIQDLADLNSRSGSTKIDPFDRSGQGVIGQAVTPYNRYATAAVTGGGMGTGTQQAQALRQQTQNTSATTGSDPMQANAYGRAADFERGLADNTSDETRRAVSQARDEVSVGMAKEGNAAMSRGADPSLFRSRALASGQRYIADVQGKALDSALEKRLGAVNALTGAAGEAATNKTNLHLGTLNAKLGQDRLAVDRSEAQARLEEAPYERLIQMMNTIAQNRDSYGALGGDGQPAAAEAPPATYGNGGIGFSGGGAFGGGGINGSFSRGRGVGGGGF
jgi:hypothetical protein